MIASITPAKLAEKTLQDIKNVNGEIKFPIDPFKLLKDNGVLISISNFEKLEGIILNDEDNVTIVGINRLRPWSRQRFSAAHKYCHFIKDLEKSKSKVNKIECLIGSNDEIEKFADKFASELLMPKYNLKELCNQYKNDKGYVDFDSVIYIAEYFGVSFESCVFRIAYCLRMIDGETESKVKVVSETNTGLNNVLSVNGVKMTNTHAYSEAKKGNIPGYVGVINNNGTKYIRSEADGSKKNNLEN